MSMEKSDEIKIVPARDSCNFKKIVVEVREIPTESCSSKLFETYLKDLQVHVGPSPPNESTTL